MSLIESIPNEILFEMIFYLESGKEIFFLRSVSKTMREKLLKFKETYPNLFDYVVYNVKSRYISLGGFDSDTDQLVEHKFILYDPVGQRRKIIQQNDGEGFYEAFNSELNPKINPTIKDLGNRRFCERRSWKILIKAPHIYFGLNFSDEEIYFTVKREELSDFQLSESNYYLMWYIIYMIPKWGIKSNDLKTFLSRPIRYCEKFVNSHKNSTLTKN